MTSKLVIGICGATCTGKSSMASALQKDFRAEIVNMDDFFWPPNSPNLEPDPGGNCFCYDDLSAIDWTSLMAEFDKCQRKSEVVIVEGILIANYRPLFAKLDLVLFLEIDKITLLERRKLRVYDPPDPPGYFERHVWPRYLHYRRILEDEGHFENFVVLNSVASTLEENIKFARRSVSAKLSR